MHDKLCGVLSVWYAVMWGPVLCLQRQLSMYLQCMLYNACIVVLYWRSLYSPCRLAGMTIL